MTAPKESPPTTFVPLFRADPEPPPAPPRPPAPGEPGYLPRPPEPLPREAPVSAHLGRFRSDPQTALRRVGAAASLRRQAWILVAILAMLVAATGYCLLHLL
jgi:hypothetical protein